MRPVKTAYLSGGMQFARSAGRAWRSSLRTWLRDALHHACFDPVVESERLVASLRRRGWRLSGRRRRGGEWEAFFRTIVRKDIAAVRRSDYVVCLWNADARRGAGTQGELTIARDAGVPVYVVSRTRRDRLPGWIQGCITEHFSGFRGLQRFLMRTYSHP